MLGFVVASLVVLVIPGPGVLYVVARSLSQGQRAGLVSVLGLSIGALVHVAAATLGLSALLLTSANAFTIVKVVGAGYLIFLGLQTLLTRQSTAEAKDLKPRDMRRLFADGVIVSVLNPKIAVFFLAYLPQFVVPTNGAVPTQVMLLGLLYVALALVTDGAYAVLSGSLRRYLGSHVVQGPLPRYGSGCVYMGLGVSMALADRQ